MTISRRLFLLGAASAAAASRLTEFQAEAVAQAELIDVGTYANVRFIPSADGAAIATTADGNWVLILHPDWEQELRDLPPPDEEEKLVHGEWARLNTIKFRRSELLPDFQRPAPLQVFRGAKWKHEQRPYHKRFA